MNGKVLAHRYRIGERIGGGGMALVYRAEDLQLGRDVAVKVLRGQFGSDEEFIRRFRREAQNAASLSHPNVVQIYDVGYDEEQYYIVMELVEGKTLKELIQQQGPLPVAEAARIAGEILSALSHAHMHRIVHRDIKPHNILIARDGRVKVTDFGIARATTTDTVTHTGSIMGSAHYFSPEQANGLPTGEKSDIYSVGIVLYEMVTGSVPFQGDSPITVALKHIRDQVVSPAQLNSEVPVELEKIILRALEKDPQDRYESAAAMRQILEQFTAAHAAGKTHMHSGDFPTMDLRAMRSRKLRRSVEEDEEEADEEEAEDPPEGGRRRSLAWLWVTLVALIVAGGIGAGVFALVNLLEVPEVDVPRIVGMPLIKAQQELKNAQLTWEVQTYQFSSDLPAEHVLRADPPEGTPVKQGRKIGLVLSRGAEEGPVPDVRGKTEDEARAILETAKFKVGQVTPKYSVEQPEGRVLEQLPGPRTMLKVGSAVDLVVSKGALKVPPVAGLKLADAQQAIVSAGLTVGTVTHMPDPVKPKDTVLTTEPGVGTRVSPGQHVNLVVSKGPESAGVPYTKVVTVPGEAGRYYDISIAQVDIVQAVPSEQPPKVTGKRLGGEKITVTGTVFGEAYLIIRVDGTQVQRIELP